MVDACTSTGILSFYGPSGDIGDPIACEDPFRNAFLIGCVGAWSLRPSQIEIARRVFSPPPDEVAWAHRVMVGLAKLIGLGDPEMDAAYGFSKRDLED